MISLESTVTRREMVLSSIQWFWLSRLSLKEIQETGKRLLVSINRLISLKKLLTSLEKDKILMPSWKYARTLTSKRIRLKSSCVPSTSDKLVITPSQNKLTLDLEISKLWWAFMLNSINGTRPRCLQNRTQRWSQWSGYLTLIGSVPMTSSMKHKRHTRKQVAQICLLESLSSSLTMQ